MTFMQIIDCKTERPDDLNRLMDTWVAQTVGKRTATHTLIGRDRDDAGHYLEIVEFPSYEEAMRNSQLPETSRIFDEIVALCGEPPTFTNLDVIRDEQLNKMNARVFFDLIASEGRLELLPDLFADDYFGHDPAGEGETVGIDALRAQVEGYRRGFDCQFTVGAQVAEGDEVATRWSWAGMHHGEFRGVAATGRECTMTGIAIFRFEDGKVKEAWWNWDNLSLYRQLGLVPEASPMRTQS
ncbi:ester cyclase [Catellatospora sichuanensis]|uniref:ester cyclase n=1 Tax=Catellatospora sichuanensis TaxID=1969805 RepID=UPI001181E509|nr:ester cyclase [Catellatospora sichuanensis]